MLASLMSSKTCINTVAFSLKDGVKGMEGLMKSTVGPIVLWET